MAQLADLSTQGTPLAPSTEKAYYRKCIELKRRLNEVEAANDEAKIKRVRLDRAIMKMRLERAFLLDELRKRMDPETVDSEGSGDEGVETPPPDRPHRDKRRRHQPLQPSMPVPPPGPSSHAHQPLMPPALPSQHEAVPIQPSPSHGYPPQHDGHPMQPPATYAPPIPHSSPYGAPVGVPGAADRQMNGGGPSPPMNRDAGATGEPLSAGPPLVEQPNGDRRVLSSSSAENANVESEQRTATTGTNGS